MSVAVSIVSTIIKSVVNSKVGNELANELIGISVDDVSEKGIGKINDFINNGRTKIEKILSKEKMKSMGISEDNIAYVIAEIKGLFSKIEVTDEIFRQCKYDSLNLCDFLWEKYSESKTGYIECESDIKKSLLAISDTLIKLMRESEEFVKDITIQISNTVDDTRMEIQRISDYLKDNFSIISADNQRNYDILMEILEQKQKNIKESNITQEEKIQNNKKDKYLKIWNSRLFLHIDNDERPITLADAFIMPDYDFRIQMGRIKFLETDTIGDIINKFIKYNATSSMLITGAPGIGKTSITAWMANEYKDNEDVVILRFRDWDSEELDNGLLKAIYNTLKCKKKELENKILILDGFDEIKSMDNRDSLLNSFLNDILDFDNLKIIVTSRPNYIDSHRFHNFFELLSFGIKKIRKFYEKIKGVELDENKIDYSNLDVIGIPVILYMAIMSDIDLTLKATKPELYSRIFAEKGGIFDKFCYEGIGYDKGNQILRDRENIKKYLNFLGEVAVEMFKNGKSLLKKEECRIPMLEFQGYSLSILDFPIRKLFENTLVNIEFIHTSIYEYFLSEYIYQIIRQEIMETKDNLAKFLGELFKNNILSFETLEFLKYKIDSSEIRKAFHSINDVFQIMLRDGMTYYTGVCNKNVIRCEIYIFANMLEIMHLWDKKICLSTNKYIKYNIELKLNLRNMIFSKKYLTGAYLKRSCLAGSDMRNVILRRTDLRGSDLRGADLRGVDLSGSDIRGANLEYAKLNGIILKGTIIDVNQMKYLEWNHDLRETLVSFGGSKKIINYEKYSDK